MTELRVSCWYIGIKIQKPPSCCEVTVESMTVIISKDLQYLWNFIYTVRDFTLIILGLTFGLLWPKNGRHGSVLKLYIHDLPKKIKKDVRNIDYRWLPWGLEVLGLSDSRHKALKNLATELYLHLSAPRRFLENVHFYFILLMFLSVIWVEKVELHTVSRDSSLQISIR